MKTFSGKTTEAQLDKAVKVIQNEGGEVKGNAFEVHGVIGFIKFNAQTGEIIIRITDKPFLASWAMIEQKLTDFFG